MAPKSKLSFLPIILVAFLCVVATAADQPAKITAAEYKKADLGLDDLGDEYKKLVDLVNLKRRPVRNFAGELDISGIPAIGSRNAPVVLVEFGDYQCSFCRRHLEQTAQRLRSRWVLSGELLYAFEDYPLDDTHPVAARAAEAARCAAEQGRYWEMRNVLYRAQKALNEAFLSAHAHSAGVDEEQFTRCMATGRYKHEIKNAIAQGKSLGIRGTPFFLLGLNEGNANVKVTRRITGAVAYEVFHREIQALRRTAEAMGEPPGQPMSERHVSHQHARM